MTTKLHAFAAALATLCIATFFSYTIIVELSGSPETIGLVKGLVVTLGLFILVPVIAITAGTGFALAEKERGD